MKADRLGRRGNIANHPSGRLHRVLRGGEANRDACM